MIRAFIFDFDGVIADSEQLHFRAFNTVLNQYGVIIEQSDYWQKYLGFTDKEAYQRISEDYGLGFDAQKIDWLIDEKAVVFDALVEAEGVLIEGVLEFIRHLDAAGMPMAICSGAIISDIEGVFRAVQRRIGINLAKYFHTIVTAENVEKGKPYPEGYLLTMERLNSLFDEPLQPSECVVLEDSHWGVEAGKAAGMKVIAVANSYSEQELAAGADMVVAGLKGLTLDNITAVLCD